MNIANFVIEEGPKTENLEELKKELDNKQKKEVILVFENEDDEMHVSVRKITERKQMFHIFGIVIKGRFKDLDFHAQYSSRDRTGYIWII